MWLRKNSPGAGRLQWQSRFEFSGRIAKDNVPQDLALICRHLEPAVDCQPLQLEEISSLKRMLTSAGQLCLSRSNLTSIFSAQCVSSGSRLAQVDEIDPGIDFWIGG